MNTTRRPDAPHAETPDDPNTGVSAPRTVQTRIVVGEHAIDVAIDLATWLQLCSSPRD